MPGSESQSFTGAHPSQSVVTPVCAARCPECGKPCLQSPQHASGSAHYCERNHRWGYAAEDETPIKAQ